MKINIVSTKLVKPCIPTPESLTKYKLSLADEFLPPQNIRVYLFYQSKVDPLLLEESLAKTLVQFYPLAGRYIKTDCSVYCSDQGVEFVEAQAVDVELIDVVGKNYLDQIKDLTPPKSAKIDEAATDPLLSVQITEFKCGGMVIGVISKHRIIDTASVGTFVAAWSNACLNPGAEMAIRPSFDSSSLFPGRNQGPLEFNMPDNEDDPDIVAKVFSFNKEAIASLKSKLSPTVGFVSKVRVVCAILTRAFIGLDQRKLGKWRPCLIGQAVNTRQRTVPPLPNHSCGNFAIPSTAVCMDSDETKDIIGIEELVRALGDALHKTIDDCSKLLSPGEDGRDLLITIWEDFMEKLKSDDWLKVMFSDWSRFGFYKADFGAGKPVWTSGKLKGHNMVVLMDNKEGDGIEAWVYFKSNDLSYLEQDEGIKMFAI